MSDNRQSGLEFRNFLKSTLLETFNEKGLDVHDNANMLGKSNPFERNGWRMSYLFVFFSFGKKYFVKN